MHLNLTRERLIRIRKNRQGEANNFGNYIKMYLTADEEIGNVLWKQV
jgi:hypothetical protein